MIGCERDVFGRCPTPPTPCLPPALSRTRCLHTLDLPDGNRTSDGELNALSAREERAVVTKDADFVNSFLLTQQPYKLLLISTGNIRNADLEALLLAELPAIVPAFATHDYLELSRSALIMHI